MRRTRRWRSRPRRCRVSGTRGGSPSPCTTSSSTSGSREEKEDNILYIPIPCQYNNYDKVCVIISYFIWLIFICVPRPCGYLPVVYSHFDHFEGISICQGFKGKILSQLGTGQIKVLEFWFVHRTLGNTFKLSSRGCLNSRIFQCRDFPAPRAVDSVLIYKCIYFFPSY